MIEDEKLKEEIDEITKNVEASSAETWQKDELKSLMKELSDTISKTNIKLEKISIRIKKIKWKKKKQNRRNLYKKLQLILKNDEILRKLKKEIQK